MKDLLLIGIGAGDPRQITYEAVDALRSACVFFVLDKGGEKDALVRLRKAILQRYRPEGGYRLVQVADPLRDGQADDYLGAVQDWHRQRAALYAQLIEQEIGDGETGAFLLWGEPTLYDSTLRILDLVREHGVTLRLQVIPGISSVQALAARHQVPLNRIGEPLTVLPGRRLARQGPIDNVVVMLDGQCAFAQLDDPELVIYWGAYLGTEDEVLIAGPLQAVKARILEVREQERRRKGWIMDTYLLRREL
ncbi:MULTISPECIES: precorrin-6A synthase (deacetylating) [Pseudomonas]|jgi:precorrin-6A synthase|uniref:Precorrin-6A synthase n=1 Tax=Pseudomonas putida NBRC 14164 TaxID=1211579 RepID=A0ABM7EDI7_PSEPU|nr:MULTISPECIES: precorrin-6A synthase (deacetylating) [Pseudomonas]EKT4462414.1 precorrin-6A synthase (deacetylating) [Pseudomonas putida]EKT4556445.1 precorrin-6A synthase (deacetylating) [Pseudomonas putida]MCX9139380.1 precorrin-6A synthase (deacetylating) [Pseudomonas sp. DCB_PUT]MDD1973852.1 precorrin-6A synthase (deacetylating) [Pseudomonas putida]MDO1465592.1 precorrin-6A synthase (deacetylating) [Pseudomonas putida]